MKRSIINNLESESIDRNHVLVTTEADKWKYIYIYSGTDS